MNETKAVGGHAGRQFGAASLTAKTVAHELSVPGSVAELATAINYATTLKSFGNEFERAGPATGARYRYAETLVSLGKLERRITPVLDARGDQCGVRTEFRTVQP